jgi:hypothetical protein
LEVQVGLVLTKESKRSFLMNPDRPEELQLTGVVEEVDAAPLLLWRRCDPRDVAPALLWRRCDPRDVAPALRVPSPLAPSWEKRPHEVGAQCVQCGRPEIPVCYGMCARCSAEDATRDSQHLR